MYIYIYIYTYMNPQRMFLAEGQLYWELLALCVRHPLEPEECRSCSLRCSWQRCGEGYQEVKGTVCWEDETWTPLRPSNTAHGGEAAKRVLSSLHWRWGMERKHRNNNNSHHHHHPTTSTITARSQHDHFALLQVIMSWCHQTQDPYLTPYPYWIESTEGWLVWTPCLFLSRMTLVVPALCKVGG